MPTATSVAATPIEVTPRAVSPLMRYLPLIGVLVLLASVTRQAARPLKDPDTWWHLRLGDEFRGSWSLSEPGQLTPFATRPWFPSQWLPEVVASKVEDVFGLPGVAWLFGVGLIALVICVFRVCRREGDVLPAAIATAMCILGASGSLSPRPQVISFVLLAVTTGVWIRTTRDLRPRWWLIALSWVWACSHGMWSTGVVVGVAVIVGLALDRRLNLRTAGKLAAVPTLSVVAAALTPVGPKLLLAPLATSGAAPFVTEWAAPSFRDITPAVTMAVIAIVVLAWSRRGRVPWSHLAILVVATGWTLLSARTVAVGAVMLAPLLAAAIQSWLPLRPRRQPKRAETVTLFGGAAACLLLLAFIVPSTASTPGRVPNAFNEELDRAPAQSVVLNDFVLGGWLHWRHRDLVPVIDGMSDAYWPEDFRDYSRVNAVAAGWQQLVEDMNADYAVVEERSPLATALDERLHWQTIGTDEGYVLMRAPDHG